jgi:lysophospholipase L1-like esterase
VTAAGAGDPGGMGAKRIWLVAVLFGLVSALILGGIVVLATRSTGSTGSGVTGTGSVDTATSAPATTVSSRSTSSSDGDALPLVALIGDSITEQGEQVLTAQLEDRWDLLVDGRSGFTTAQQLPAARRAADSQPTQVIINLGSNDVAAVAAGDEVGDELTEMVSLFPSARCIHLVEVNEGIEWGGRSFFGGAAAINQAIATLAAADPRIGVVAWSDAVAAAEAGGLPDGPVLEDTVHPTTAGQQLLARLYGEALAACPPS